MREIKKIAILGGGITGLSAAYYLVQKGHKVTMFEKELVLGGLAIGFNPPAGGKGAWEWPLERAYHHLFATDNAILEFAKEIGFNKIFFNTPQTASLYQKNGKLLTIPLDNPIDLVRFPLLPLIDRFRAGIVLVFLKLTPFFKLFETFSAEEFLRKTMGERAWKVLWQELFRKKFGKYAGNILTSFIWARIKVRTKKLGYIEGGFQTLVEYAERNLAKKGVEVKKGYEIEEIKKQGGGFVIDGAEYDAVISTLPTAILKKVASDLFPKEYLARFDNLHYLHAIVLIVESDKPLLDKTYWLNVIVPEFPMMVLVQHTNMIDKKHYGGKHILYIGNYVDSDSPLLKMSDKVAMDFFSPYLKQINTKYSILNTKYYFFKAPFAQPIFDKTFLKNMPTFKTSVENFYIANLDMTYPHDRGTNYAVKLGREVANLV